MPEELHLDRMPIGVQVANPAWLAKSQWWNKTRSEPSRAVVSQPIVAIFFTSE